MTRFPQNRGEAATTLENYGRAAGAIPPAASRAAGAKKHNYQLL